MRSGITSADFVEKLRWSGAVSSFSSAFRSMDCLLFRNEIFRGSRQRSEGFLLQEEVILNYRILESFQIAKGEFVGSTKPMKSRSVSREL